MAFARKFWIPVLLILALLAGEDWLRLGWQAWNYPTADQHARGQLVLSGNYGYLAASADGLEVLDIIGNRPVARISTPSNVDRIDDIAISDGLLFALDATPPGFLMVYTLANPLQPKLVGKPLPMEVGPFSGVSAADGMVMVSGGTSRMNLRTYDDIGRLSAQTLFADFGRGQPDVSLHADGKLAAISTHLYGPKFAITLARIDRNPLRLQKFGQLELSDAGFTEGGFKPAHFPIVSAWRRNALYLAHGGGLDTVVADALSPPRFLAHDHSASPAMDVVTVGEKLYVLRAGNQPAILRYRLDASGLPTLEGQLPVSTSRHLASIAGLGPRLLLVNQQTGSQVIPANIFIPVTPTSQLK